jgi:hypothetical protein
MDWRPYRALGTGLTPDSPYRYIQDYLCLEPVAGGLEPVQACSAVVSLVVPVEGYGALVGVFGQGWLVVVLAEARPSTACSAYITLIGVETPI